MNFDRWLAVFNFSAMCFWCVDNWWWAPKRSKKLRDKMVDGIIDNLKKSDQVIYIKEDKHVMKTHDDMKDL